MAACFCTGACRITGMCGGQRIWQLQPVQPQVDRRKAIDYAPERLHSDALTPTEAEVLRLVASGLTNEQIAVVRGRHERTVRNHLNSIVQKVGAKNRTEAARWAWRTGLVTIDDAWATLQEQLQGG